MKAAHSKAIFKKITLAVALFLLVVIVLIIDRPARAATRTWDNDSTDGLWSTCANWSADTCPTGSDIAFFDSTSTTNASIDGSFAGSVGGLTISTGYSGTITQARSLTIGSSGYSQSTGTFTGATQTIDLNGTFSLTGGIFTSTSGTFSINNNFTISGSPTFNANGGTVLFDTGNGVNQSIACNSATFNAVTITGSLTVATTTIGSACTLPLGNSATAQGFITNNGTINVGTGTFTITGGYTQNGGSTLTMGGTTLDMNGSLTLSGGSFPAGITTMTLTGSLTNTANLLPNDIALTIDSGAGATSTLSCGTATFASVVISQSLSATGLTVGSNCTLPLGNSPTSSSLSIVNNGTINVGTGTWTVNASYTQNTGSTLTMGGTVMDVNGSLTLTDGVFPAGLATLSLTGSLTNTANLLPNGIALTLDAGAGTSSTLSCGTVTFASAAISQSLSSTGLTIGSTCTLPLGNSPTSSSTSITNNGTITVGTGTWTINANYTMNTGSVVTMSGTTIDMNGSMTLSGGSFPAGITTMSVRNNLDNTGNLLPNGIAFTFDGVTEDTSLTCGTATLGSVVLNKTNLAGELGLAADCTVTGDFTRTLGTVTNPGSAKTWFIGGNFSMASTNTMGGSNLTFEFTGGSNKTITQTAGTFSAKLKVNKTVGSSLTQATALVLGGTFEVASGTFDQGATFNLTTGGATTIGSSGTWSNTGTGDISLAGDVGNSGTITLDGSGVGCGGADAIAISSSSSPTQRTWSGSGTTTITDVAATDQAGTITAKSSTNTSNNAWTFIGCNTNPDAPGSLGPASYVNGSWGNDNTPTLTFSLSDPDGSDTVGFRIQIDDTSDFSSVVVDYTSAVAAQGSFSFTVGQAAGGGSYTTGSGGQTLADSSGYYWQVKAIDNSAAESSYSTANSGAIAFKVDTAAPTAGTVSTGTITTSSITATVAGASDALSGLAAAPYNIQNSTAATSSGAQAGTSWASNGLSVNVQYTFFVTVTDLAGNTANSANSSAYTLANPPSALILTVDSSSQITATWNVNSNPAGTAFFAANTTASTDSGWVADGVSWMSTSLSPSTLYNFSVKARNGDGTETSAVTDSATTSAAADGGGGGNNNNGMQEPNGGFRVTINSGDTTTNSRNVTLTLSGGPDANYIRISDHSLLSPYEQMDYEETISWDICEFTSTCEPGTYTVYVRFYKNINSSSQVVSDTIVLTAAETPPPPPPPPVVIPPPPPAEPDCVSYPPIQLRPPEISFSENISHRQTHPQVVYLQRFLNDNGFMVALSGAGSPGHEVEYYGDNTRDAVRRFQTAYADLIGNNGKSGNLVTPTRAFINSLYVSPPVICDHDPVIIPPGNDDPIGHVDENGTNGGTVITGWAVDPNDPDAPVTIEIYFEDPTSPDSDPIVIVADDPRPDVNDVTGYPDDHGFSVVIPPGAVEGTYTVFVYANDTDEEQAVLLDNSSSGGPSRFDTETNEPLPDPPPPPPVTPPGPSDPETPSITPPPPPIDRPNGGGSVDTDDEGSGGAFDFTQGFVPDQVQESTQEILEMVPGGTMSLRFITFLLLITPLITTGSALIDLLSGLNSVNYFKYWILALMEALGLRRKRNPWGVVFDSKTLQPIPHAHVNVLNERLKILESTIAGPDGRYAFLISPRGLAGSEQKIQFFAEHPKYKFPTQKTFADMANMPFGDIYLGGMITVNPQQSSNLDLPMDPIAKTRTSPRALFRKALITFSNFSFWAAFPLTVAGYIAQPDVISFGLIVLFVFIAIARLLKIRPKPFGIIRNSATGLPMALAPIYLTDLANNRVTFAVSDFRGRYFMMVPKGKYYLHASTSGDVPQPRHLQKELTTGNGWVSQDLKV